MKTKNSKKSTKNKAINLHLTCGIYFSLLNEASNAGIQELVKCFIKLLDSKVDLNNSSLFVKISKLSHCDSSPSSLPFPLPAEELQVFKSKIKNSDQKFLDEFTNTIQPYFINDEKNKWLVNKLIEIICNDELVDESQKFYKDYNNDCVSAKTLNKFNKFNFYHFLIGTILFIMEYSKDNKEGGDTFNELFEKGKNNKEGYCLKDKYKNSNHENSIILVDNIAKETIDNMHPDEQNNQLDENISPEEAKRKKEWFENISKILLPVAEVAEYYSKPWNWKKTSEDNNEDNDDNNYNDIEYDNNLNARKMNNCDVDNGTVGIYHNFDYYYDEDTDDSYDIDLCHSRDQCPDLVNYIDNSISLFEKLSFNFTKNKTLRLSDIYINLYFGDNQINIDEKKAYLEGYVDESTNESYPNNYANNPYLPPDNFFNYFQKKPANYLFLANGGAGKSTFLKHAMLKMLYNSSDAKILPIFIDSKNYKKGLLNDKIQEAKKLNNLNYKIIVLIDAFDEMPSQKSSFKDELNAINSIDKGINFILTSRPDPKLNSIIGNFNIKYLHPLTTFQISDFITKINALCNQCFNKKIIDDLNMLTQNNYGIMSTPLFLIFVIRITIQQNKVPEKITNIFEMIFDNLFYDSKRLDKNLDDRNNDTNLTYDNLKDIVSYLSYNLSNPFNNYYSKASIKKQFKLYSQKFDLQFDSDKLLYDLCTTIPLLEEVVEDNELYYKFIFNSIEEYFIANFYLNNIDTFLSDLKNKKFDGLEEYAETYKVIPLLLDLYKDTNDKTESAIIKPMIESILALYPTPEDYIRANYGEIYMCVDTYAAMFANKNTNLNDFQNKPEFYIQDVVLRYYNRKPPELHYEDFIHAPHLNLYKLSFERRNSEKIIKSEPPDFLKNSKLNNFTNQNKSSDEFLIDTQEVFHYKDKLQDLYNVILSTESEFVQEYEFFKQKLDEINKTN